MAASLKPKQNARGSISASVMAVSPRFSYFWKITPYDLKRHCVKGCFCKVYWAVHAHSCIMGNQGKMAGNSKAASSSRIYIINTGCLCEKSTLRVQRNYTLNLECKEVRDQVLENPNLSIHVLYFSVILIMSNYRKCMGISWISWNIMEYLFAVSNFKHPTCPVFKLPRQLISIVSKVYIELHSVVFYTSFVLRSWYAGRTSVRKLKSRN